LSIVLLAILAVMWVVFLLPVIAPRQRLGGARPALERRETAMEAPPQPHATAVVVPPVPR
jgi:hypothetical protein